MDVVISISIVGFWVIGHVYPDVVAKIFFGFFTLGTLSASIYFLLINYSVTVSIVVK